MNGVASETRRQVIPARSGSDLRTSLPSGIWAQILLFAAVLAVLSQALTQSSLWIDEGFSAYLASIRGFPSFLRVLQSCDAGDLQTGGYYVYLWAWRHLFGVSEFALRASNLPFLIILCAGFCLTSYFRFRSSWLWTICVASPFVWVYLNEARAYLPMLASASLCLCGYFLGDSGENNLAGEEGVRRQQEVAHRLAPYLFWTGLALVSFFSLLAALLYPALAFLVLSSRAARTALWQKAALFAAPLLLVEACYYGWALFRQQDITYDQFRPAYAWLWIYEFAGFSGIGPGRNRLRLIHDHFLSYPSLLVAVGVAVLMAVILACAYAMAPKSNRAIAARLTLLGAVSVLLALALSYFLNERLLPRHGAAIYPLFLYALLALLSASAYSSRGFRMSWLAAACLAVVWLTSDFRMRFLQQYDKEDYRSAVAETIRLASAEKLRIFWAADFMTAAYYGLALDHPFEAGFGRVNLTEVFSQTGWKIRGRGIYASNVDERQSSQFSQAGGNSTIVLTYSKPDLYDLRRFWARQQSIRTATLLESGGTPIVTPGFTIEIVSSYRQPSTPISKKGGR